MCISQKKLGIADFFLASSELLVNVMWSLHTYYKQFSQHVTDEIGKQKAPIEKELKVC